MLFLPLHQARWAVRRLRLQLSRAVFLPEQ